MTDRSFEWSRDQKAKTDPVPVNQEVFHRVGEKFDVSHRRLYLAIGNMQDGLSVGINERLADDEYELLSEDDRAWYLHVPESLWRRHYRNHNGGTVNDDDRYRAAQACHDRQAQCAPSVDTEDLETIPADRQVLVIAKPDSKLDT